MPGIESISGSMKEKSGSRIVFKTFSKPSVNRGSKPETRIYLMRRQERSTPLSENEIAVRKRFSEAATYFKNLSEKQRMAYRELWRRDEYRFNGKVYVTLRGYVMARFMAGNKQLALPAHTCAS